MTSQTKVKETEKSRALERTNNNLQEQEANMRKRLQKMKMESYLHKWTTADLRQKWSNSEARNVDLVNLLKSEKVLRSKPIAGERDRLTNATEQEKYIDTLREAKESEINDQESRSTLEGLWTEKQEQHIPTLTHRPKFVCLLRLNNFKDAILPQAIDLMIGIPGSFSYQAFEIYKDEERDLLTNISDLVNKTRGNRQCLPKTLNFENAEQIKTNLDKAVRRRSIDKSNIHDVSSRGLFVCILTLEDRPTIAEPFKLYLIDLAGSEKNTFGKEAKGEPRLKRSEQQESKLFEESIDITRSRHEFHLLLQNFSDGSQVGPSYRVRTRALFLPLGFSELD
ncbi:MAG: hypothetical protein Q9190_000358 [Brigantiaea leucoxantha]